MANIRFIVRNQNVGVVQTIYVTSRFGRNEKLMYATPLKVDPLYWDAERQRVKSSIYCLQRDEINNALDGLMAKINTFMAEVTRDGGVVSKNSLLTFLDQHFGRQKAKALSFHAFFEDFIEACKNRMNSHRGGQVVTRSTRWEYARTLYYIKGYEKENGVFLDFGDIDQDFLVSFAGYLQKENLATNTIAHKVICIKAVMRAAMERGITLNDKWKFYRNATEQTDAVALNEQELQLLYELDLSKDPRLDKVRDIFLVGCWTGLRFSDIKKIQKENIKDGIITLVQSKTNDIVSIPVHPVFMGIWEKYDGQLPSRISNQKFNIYIKEVCKKAGLDDDVLRSITKGGKKITTKYEKWQLVSSHTARRSFATNLYRSGFPSISIMQITGHKTESAFLRYIKVSKQEHARLLAEHWRKLNPI